VPVLFGEDAAALPRGIMLYWLLYFFLAFGAKLLLALITIYLLLPQESSCNGCDEETLLLQATRADRVLSIFCLGRLRRRWCPHCGWEGFARTRSTRTGVPYPSPARGTADSRR
jgi:hypothetical protein